VYHLKGVPPNHTTSDFLIPLVIGTTRCLRKDANSISQEQQAAAQTPTRSQTKPSPTGNPFAQMVQQLAQINSNTAMAASVAKASAQAEQYKRMFEEEKAREQAQQNQALIDAIKNSGMGRGGTGSAAAAEPPKKNFLESFLGGAAGAVGKMLFDGLVKGLSKLRVIIVAAFTAAMPFLRKMLTKVLSFALKRALFLIPGIGLLLGSAALAYDVADMAGAFDGDEGDDAGKPKSPSKGSPKGKKASQSNETQYDAMGNVTGYGPSSPEDQGVSNADMSEATKNENYSNEGRGRKLSMIDRARVAMGIPVGGTSPSSPSSAQGTSPSPVGKPTTAGAAANKPILWRVPLRNSYTVTSEFGEKRGKHNNYDIDYTHKGIDLALSQGAPVVAAADGMITVNTSNQKTGNFVMMDHGKGYTTLYAHLLMSHSLPGTKVTAGTVIGYVGNTGTSSRGAHLHFEIRLNGVSKNPRDFIELGKKAQLTKIDPQAETPKPGNADAGEAADPKKASGPTSRRNNSKFNVPGYAAQVNKKLTDNAVTKYYKALSDGKTEAEAKKLALNVASTNTVAKQAVEEASEKFKAEVENDTKKDSKSPEVPYNEKYLQEVIAGKHPRPMLSVEKAQEMLKVIKVADETKKDSESSVVSTTPLIETSTKKDSKSQDVPYNEKYLQEVVAGKHPRPLLSVEKAQEMLKVMSEGKLTTRSLGAIKVEPINTAPTSTTAVTPLIEMGDGSVAEAAAASTPSNAVVNARNKAIADKFLTERKAEEGKKEVVKLLRQTSENTRLTAKELKSNRITMSKGKFTRPEDLLAKANKQFTDSLQRQLTKTISGTLMSALYPGGYKNVSQKTASGQMYRGEQLNKMLGVTPALTKLGTSIFGKQYGPAFGQIFSKVGTAYMEVGARSVAQGIFGSAFKGAGMADGVAEQQANILGGQILGNLAKGTKQGKLTALEQILYGVSGGEVALGPETIFAKYGFASPQDGIGYMANVLGSSLMSPINSGLGTTPLNMRNMDPRMKTMGAFGGYGGEYGGLPTGMPSGATLQAASQNNPLMQVTKDGMVVLADNVPQLTKDIGAQLNTAKQAEIDAQERFVNAERGSDERSIAQKMVSEAQYEQQILTNKLLSSRGPGGGTSVSVGGSGGGGFFSGGGPLAEVGNMALDLGKSAITQKVVQSLGIKNPYMNMLASFAVNKGVSYLGGKAYDMFAGTEFGGTLISGAKDLLPSWLGGSTFTTNPAAYSGFAPTATQYGAFGEAPLGVDAVAGSGGVSPVLTGFETVAPYLPYIPAFVALMQGDVGAAAGYAIGAYAGAALGAELASAGFAAGGPIGAVAGFLIGTFLGGLFGDDDDHYVPNPTIWRIIRVRNNNNINSIVDLQAPQENPPKQFFDLCDSLLRVGFNATKSAENATKKPTPYDFIMCTMNARDGVYFSMRTGDPTSADTHSIHLGVADKTFAPGKAASEIVKLVTKIFKEAYAADATALDEASKLLNKKTYKELSTDLTKELKKGKDKLGTGKLDTSIERGVFGGTLAEDAIIVAGRTNAPKAAVNNNDGYGYNYSGGADSPPMVYSMKEGKYVEAPSEMKEVDVVDDTNWGSFTRKVTKKVYTPGVLMLDKDGNPILDKNNNGSIDLGDISTSVTPVSDLKAAYAASGSILKDLMYPGATTGTTGTTGAVTVNTVADNSQKNNQSVNTYYASTLSKTKNPIKDAMLQTGMPA
jgi:murein DD-endopeptidase MepM/ murein hydrolase activator NlpD